MLVALLQKLDVVQLLKSWEYKNSQYNRTIIFDVVQLLKSWEYKNEML